MPIITNQETGEKKEISMEEFMEILSKGNGGLQQIVTDANGNKTVTDIYGNISGVSDGMDRSLNIFIHSDVISSFVKEALAAAEDEEDQSEQGDEQEYLNSKRITGEQHAKDIALIVLILQTTDGETDDGRLLIALFHNSFIPAHINIAFPLCLADS